MQVEMEDVLPSAPFHVEDKAVPGPVNRLALCNILGPENQVGDQETILLAQVIDAADVVSGNNQNVNGSLRSDVVESYDPFVLVNKVGFLLTPDDPAEQAICGGVHGQSTFPSWV
jgi:hypothetical protein